jgi:4-diphosphocytidyl-2-C-methyl-D-erythritol kinase
VELAKSYAKINLFLRLLGKRGDGYHNIFTLFCAVDLYDTIGLSFAETPAKTHIICDNADIPVDSGNIILKTDKILRDEYGLALHFKIELNKSIPVGAGLGGGSGNAAAYLMLVNKAAGMGLNRAEMCKILEKVGSDCCFFLYPPMALGEGRGERITPVENTSELLFVIVNPGIFISTTLVYSSEKILLTERTLLPKIPCSLNLDRIVEMMSNDLEPAVYDICPVSAELCVALKSAGALKAMVSGSGSSVFGIFESIHTWDAAYRKICEMYPEYKVFKVKSLSKAQSAARQAM